MSEYSFNSVATQTKIVLFAVVSLLSRNCRLLSVVIFFLVIYIELHVRIIIALRTYCGDNSRSEINGAGETPLFYSRIHATLIALHFCPCRKILFRYIILRLKMLEKSLNFESSFLVIFVLQGAEYSSADQKITN